MYYHYLQLLIAWWWGMYGSLFLFLKSLLNCNFFFLEERLNIINIFEIHLYFFPYNSDFLSCNFDFFLPKTKNMITLKLAGACVWIRSPPLHLSSFVSTRADCYILSRDWRLSLITCDYSSDNEIWLWNHT